MVDSGTKNSAISEDMLLDRSGFVVRPPSKYLFTTELKRIMWLEKFRLRLDIKELWLISKKWQ
jgi:hypothetical protein